MQKCVANLKKCGIIISLNIKKAMKKRQTEYTQAQRGLSPAERRPEPCGKPFTLELSAFKRRTGFSRYREKSACIFAGTRVVPRKLYAFVPWLWDGGVFCF